METVWTQLPCLSTYDGVVYLENNPPSTANKLWKKASESKIADSFTRSILKNVFDDLGSEWRDRLMNMCDSGLAFLLKEDKSVKSVFYSSSFQEMKPGYHLLVLLSKKQYDNLLKDVQKTRDAKEAKRQKDLKQIENDLDALF